MWRGESAWQQVLRAVRGPTRQDCEPRFGLPESYTPRHLAEKILTSKSALEGERKQVTVLFADLKGSMELLADRDPEEARKLLDPVLERMMEAVHRYAGTVNQVMGDGIMALFGAPVGHEDHAVRACYAALDMQAAIRRYADDMRRTHGAKVQVRVGLNSGEVVVRAIGSDLRMDYTAVGQTTHLAARMEQLADPGATLLTADTLRLADGYIEVKPLGPVPVKGLEAPVEVYEMVGAGPLRSRLGAAAARGLTRFVGRESELEQVRQALGRAVAGHGQVVAIVGEPGVGKSRLVWELTHSHRTHGWLIVQASTLSYGKATPYLPVIELLKSYFQIEDRDDPRKVREKVTGKLLALDRALEAALPAFLTLLNVPVEDTTWQAHDPPQRRQRTLDAIERLLLRESQVQPLLLVFEDLQWMDSESQALLDGLVDRLPTARVLLLVDYRPEYQHGWDGKTYYVRLRLDPLPREGAEELLQVLLGTDVGLLPLKRVLIERTEGNPFFLEESVRTLVETGVLVGERGAYRLTKAPDTIQVPGTVRAVLAARIDRLRDEPKRLLQTASILGREAPLRLLTAIWEGPGELGPHLGELTRLEFLYEQIEVGDTRYVFRHALTQEVAYASLLTSRRQSLHSAAGRALETFDPEAKPYTLLAHHFRAAGDLEKALTYHTCAADAARQVYAVKEALEHYTGALEAAALLGLDTGDRRTSRLHVRRGQVAAQTGDVVRARADFEEALEGAQASGDQTTEMEALNELGFFLAGAADYREGIPRLEAALRIAEAPGRPAEPGDDPQPALHHVHEPVAVRSRRRARTPSAGARAGPRGSAGPRHGPGQPRGSLRHDRGPRHGRCGRPSARGDSPTTRGSLVSAVCPLSVVLGACRGRTVGRCHCPNRGGPDRQPPHRRSGKRAAVPGHPRLDPPEPWGVWASSRDWSPGRGLGARARALEWIAWSEALLGWTLRELYALDRAVEHLQRGLEAAERAGAPYHELRCAAHLAWACWGLGDFEPALAVIERAERLLRQISAPPQRAFLQGADAYVALARVRLAQREAGRVEALLSDLLAAAEASASQEVIAEASLVIGQSRAAGGDARSAESALGRALKVASVIGLPGTTWRVHAELARLCRADGRVEEAASHLTRSRALIEQLSATIEDKDIGERFLTSALAELGAGPTTA
jgi:class 3 adenylate cyclase/tetratricopeptide (TPR) repeat protein